MRARAPASAANLGPGFDTLALALDRYVEVEVEPSSRLIVRSEGEGAGLSDDAGHLAARVAMDVAGHDRLAITVRSQIPVARGLGSSAALAVAAAAAAGSPRPAGGGRPGRRPSRERRRQRVVGGLLVAATVRGVVKAVRMPLDPQLAVVAIVPDRALATAKARQVLPSVVSRADAAFNLGRMGLLLAGLADHRYLIREAAEDRLHQDYRSPLFPEAPKLLAGLLAGGALAACWSGAGPSLLGICTATDAPGVETAARAAMDDADVPGRVLALRVDTRGLTVGEGNGLPLFGPGGNDDPATESAAEVAGAGEVFDFDERG